METVNQVITEQGNQTADNPQEKTFTQAEVDAIISDRLQRERSKYADFDT